MSASEAIPFVKLEGCGNDYLFVELDRLAEPLAAELLERGPELAVRWSHRHFGVGADGLVALEGGAEGALARMRMWNADGSRGSLCGNALRCVAKLVGERPEHAHLDAFALRSEVGLHRVEVTREGNDIVWSEVEIGAPRFAPAEVPLDFDHAERLEGVAGEAVALRLQALGAPWEGIALSLGNPHFVVPLDRPPSELPLGELGRALEQHAAFPERVNVGFARLDDDGTLLASTYERGSGLTQACGSSACAMTIAFTCLGPVERGRELAVAMPGGSLAARWSTEGPVFLAGPAREAFRGRILSG